MTLPFDAKDRGEDLLSPTRLGTGHSLSPWNARKNKPEALDGRRPEREVSVRDLEAGGASPNPTHVVGNSARFTCTVTESNTTTKETTIEITTSSATRT